MNHNYSGINNLNGLNSNMLNKFTKVNRQNYKTISINNNNSSNYIKNTHSKDIIQQSGNIQDKKKKLSITKFSNMKKEKKNYIPKMKSDNTETQIIFNNNEPIIEISHHRNNSSNSQIKKEVHQRYTSSSQKKLIITNNNKNSKDINMIRKKLIIGNVPMISNNNISHKHIPISNELLTTNINNDTKFIKRSNTNSNINDNINNMNYYGEIFRYKNIIKILMFYIENLNKKIKLLFNKNQIEKNNKIKELSLQNKFLINENKNLKFKLIQFFYIMKSYINNGNKIYDEKYLKIIKDILVENKFLRSINILPKNINNAYLSQLQKQIQIEKLKKELLFQKQFTKIEENKQKNISKNSKEIKDNNNPFNNDESSLNELSKGSHKRQRTHFNLGKLNEENSINSINSSNKESTVSNNNISNTSSENTAIENKSKEKGKESLILKHIKNKTHSKNALSEALNDNFNKTLKKVNDNSKKNILEHKKENELNNKIINENKNNIGNNIYPMMKNNKIGKGNISSNIPVNINMNKIEYINYSNENINKNNNIKNDRNQNEDKSLNGNENSGNKKQQNIYYRASKEKEKKKSVFNK